MEPEDLLREKGKRARRRELESVREAGHLKLWFRAQDWEHPQSQDGIGYFKQFYRAIRHSCHCMGCTEQRHYHERLNRRERRQAKQELRKPQS